MNGFTEVANHVCDADVKLFDDILKLAGGTEVNDLICSNSIAHKILTRFGQTYLQLADQLKLHCHEAVTELVDFIIVVADLDLQ